MEQVLLCSGQMQQRLNISRSTLLRRVRQGHLPKPVKPCGKPNGRCYWPKDEVEEAERRWRQERETDC